MLDFACPACPERRAVEDRVAGKTVRCPRCGRKLRHQPGVGFLPLEAPERIDLLPVSREDRTPIIEETEPIEIGMPPPSPPPSRVPFLAGIFAAVAVVFGLVIIIVLVNHKPARKPRPPAREEPVVEKKTPSVEKKEEPPKFEGIDSVLVLKDATAISGPVAERETCFEIMVGGTIRRFDKKDVDRWIKSPQELFDGKEQLVESALQLLQWAGRQQDRNEAYKLLRTALRHAEQARDSLERVRRFFVGTEHAWLDGEIGRCRDAMREIQVALDALPVVKADAFDEPEIKPEERGPLPETVRGLLDSIERRRDAARRRRGRDVVLAMRGLWDGGDLRAALLIFLTRSEADWGLGDETALASVSLQTYFRKVLLSNPKELAPALHIEAAGLLAEKMEQTKNDALLLFLAAHLNEAFSLATRQEDRDKLAAIATKAGFTRSGDRWGTRAGLRLWEYAEARRRGDRRALSILEKAIDPDSTLRYVIAAATYEQGIVTGKDYRHAISLFEAVGGSDEMRAHVAALVKSMKDAAPCSTCGGGGTVRCRTCGGSKVLFCGTCGGAGQIMTPGERAPTKKCPACAGSGRVGCTECKGVGTTRCRACTGLRTVASLASIAALRICPMCGGSGVILSNPVLACPDCLGAGTCLAPNSDRTRVVTRSLREADTVQLFPWGFGTRTRTSLFSGLEVLGFPEPGQEKLWTADAGVLRCANPSRDDDAIARFDTIALPPDFVVAMSFAVEGTVDPAGEVQFEFGPSKVTPKDLLYSVRVRFGPPQVELGQRTATGWATLGLTENAVDVSKLANWNTLEVRVRNGEVSISLNGKAVLTRKLPEAPGLSPSGLRVRGGTVKFEHLTWMPLAGTK